MRQDKNYIQILNLNTKNMGINSRGIGGGSNITFLNVFQGNLVIEYDDREKLENKLDSLGLDTEGVKVRQRVKGKNEGKDVFYFVLFDISGMLTGVTIKELPFGEFVELELTDVDEKFVVSLGDVTGRIAKDFARKCGNIDLGSELVFGVWNLTAEQADNGKAKSGVRMYQDGEKIDFFISYEDLPAPEQKKRGRKVTWDYTEQEDFLYQAIEGFSASNFKDTTPVSATTAQPKVEVASTTVEDDDLPF